MDFDGGDFFAFGDDGAGGGAAAGGGGTWDAMVVDDAFQPDFGGDGASDWVAETDAPEDVSGPSADQDQEEDVAEDAPLDDGAGANSDDGGQNNDWG